MPQDYCPFALVTSLCDFQVYSVQILILLRWCLPYVSVEVWINQVQGFSSHQIVALHLSLSPYVKSCVQDQVALGVAVGASTVKIYGK